MIFSKITYHNNLGTTPARVNRQTGELQINLPVWEKLTSEEKRFVELHEEGHLVLQTKNELAADRYAFKKYADEGYSLKAGVKALTKVLQDKPNHLIRSNEILKQATQYQKNRSMEAENIFISQAWENFLGFGKKAKARREERRERKDERKDLRVQRRYDRNERKNLLADAKAQQKVLLTERGVSAGGMLAGGIGNAVGNLGNAFANVATGGLSGGLGGLLGGLGANGLPAGTPQTNTGTYSSSEMALGSGGGGGSFQQDYESATDPLSFPFNTNGIELPSDIQKNKSLPLIIGAVLAVVVVLALIMRKS